MSKFKTLKKLDLYKNDLIKEPKKNNTFLKQNSNLLIVYKMQIVNKNCE